MKKQTYKKGFSLVELIAVVAIMSIALVAAVPIYTSIMTNSNNKTCASNIEIIKSGASSYYSANGQTGVPSLNELRAYLADDIIPPCPLAEIITEGEHKGEATPDTAYKIYLQPNGSVKVVCPMLNPDGSVDGLTHKHNPEGSEALNWEETGTELQ